MISWLIPTDILQSIFLKWHINLRTFSAEKSRGEVIHSGHFMISSVADQDELDDDVSHDRDSPVHHDQAIRLRQGYDFSDVSKETQV